MKDSKDFMNDALVNFLETSLNVELVHIILKAIEKSHGKIKDNSN